MRKDILSGPASLSDVVDAEAKLIEDLPKLLPDAEIVENGVKLTTKQIVARLQSYVMASKDLAAMCKQAGDIVAAQKVLWISARIMVVAIKLYVAANLGVSVT